MKFTHKPNRILEFIPAMNNGGSQQRSIHRMILNTWSLRKTNSYFFCISFLCEITHNYLTASDGIHRSRIRNSSAVKLVSSSSRSITCAWSPPAPILELLRKPNLLLMHAGCFFFTHIISYLFDVGVLICIVGKGLVIGIWLLKGIGVTVYVE